MPTSASPATVSAADRVRRVTTSVAPAAQEAQQEEEQVDEVEVKAQRADDRATADLVVRRDGRDHFQLLRVPRGQFFYYGYGDHRDDELQRRRLPEEPDDHGD